MNSNPFTKESEIPADMNKHRGQDFFEYLEEIMLQDPEFAAAYLAAMQEEE